MTAKKRATSSFYDLSIENFASGIKVGEVKLLESVEEKKLEDHIVTYQRDKIRRDRMGAFLG
jgi:hypothetical protein